MIGDITKQIFFEEYESFYAHLHKRFFFACLLFIPISNAFSQGSQHRLLKLLEVHDSRKELYDRYDSLTKDVTNHVVDRNKLLAEVNPRNNLELPQELNAIIISPNKSYFVAYEEQEQPSPFIFFYNIHGELLNTVATDIYPNIKYSKNSEYVEIFNAFGREFMIYTKEGRLIQKGNYIDLIQDNQEVLYNIFVSNDGENLLLSTSSRIHFFSMDKRKIWEHPSTSILDCQFVEGQRVVSLKSSSQVRDKDSPFNFEILSTSDGQLLDSISKVAEVTFLKNVVIIKKNSEFYEYEYRR